MDNTASVRGFTLPTLPNSSTSSLMDAVVGGNKTHPSAKPSTPFTLGRLNEEPAVALADASATARVNNDGDNKEDVQELEAKLQKRRSLIPHLENELAELEAQIKAAEERLNRATAGNNTGTK